MTTGFASALGLTGEAELVDAGPVMDAARRIKMAEEITCLEVASAISESALACYGVGFGAGDY